MRPRGVALLKLRTARPTKESIVMAICEQFNIYGPQVSTGSTINTEVLQRIAGAACVDISSATTSYKKFETLLKHFGQAYDPTLDSSEHSATGGGTISGHGWRKLARATGSAQFAFVLNIAEAPVSEKYEDNFGVSYGFNKNVAGRIPLLEAGVGSRVIFYNTVKSKLEPRKSFIGSGEVSKVLRLGNNEYKLEFANVKKFLSPISRDQVEITGWNNQNAIAEIEYSGFEDMERMGMQSPNVEQGERVILEAVTSGDSHAFDVDVRPDTASLRIYRGMTFTAHYALGEFIDNSITSALKNKLKLQDAFGDDYQLIVQVKFDNQDNCLVVEDNAAGIAKEDIGKALKAGATRNDNQVGLAKYGVGMKAAAFWFGSILEVETYPLGESTGWKVVLDISGDEALPAEVSVTPIPHRGSPGTILRVRQLWNGSPKTKALATIRRYLPSIYRSFLQPVEASDNTILTQLFFEDARLQYHEPELLEECFWASEDGPVPGAETRTWRQNVTIHLSDSTVITGWIGILKTMSRDLSGLTLFYRGKAISGAVPVGDTVGDEDSASSQSRSYKPRNVFKQVGSKLDQSLIGEFDVTALGKTLTTDSPRWTTEEEEQFANELLKCITSNYEGFDAGENLMKMALNFRRRPGNQAPKKKQELEQSDKALQAQAQKALDGNVYHGVTEASDASAENNFEREDLDGIPVTINLTDDEGHVHVFSLALGQHREAEFFTVRDAAKHKHIIEVNLAHPILDSIDSSDTDIRKVIQFLTLGLGVAEIFADSEDGVILRRKFNNSLESIGQLGVQGVE